MSTLQTYDAKLVYKLDPHAPALAIGIPTRKLSPIEFTMSLIQLLTPLNVKLYYIIQKAADVKGGLLGAEARNAILESALAKGTPYVLFIDDDMALPDITAYRLWNQIRMHPEAACVTAVYTTKLEPAEPLMYIDDSAGAYWDWPCGTLLPIHSAGAGCMIVNMDYVRKLEPPWFDDQASVETRPDKARVKHHWGHDRFFHNRLREEAGGLILADTGLHLGHFDPDTQKYYFLSPDAPCFRQPYMGESFIPVYGGNPPSNSYISWRRVIPAPSKWMGFGEYLEHISGSADELNVSLLKERANVVSDRSDLEHSARVARNDTEQLNPSSTSGASAD